MTAAPSRLAFLRVALAALAIMFLPQGIWSALIALNLRTTPRFPWAVVVVLIAATLVVRSLWSAVDSSNHRHAPPRMAGVTKTVLAWSCLAGACALVALVGLWIVLASLVRMPGTVLPDLSRYPRWTAALAIATGAAISPLCEQIGLWGYGQVVLERRFPAPVAIVTTALVFAVLPHPPSQAALWPKWLFFFSTGLMFSMMAYVTDSIVPGLIVHAVSLLTFFVFVWPFDPQRPLVTSAGADIGFAMRVGQTVVFGSACVWAFTRVRKASRPPATVEELSPFVRR